MDIFSQFGRNEILIATVSAWAIAQGIKVFLGVLKEKRFNFRWFIGTGGMPSSHSAGAVAMATTCGLVNGFDSALFGVAFLVAFVTMFDAQGVRRAAGSQAEILNRILDDFYQKKLVQEERLKELLGHTPIEVFAGAVLGIGIAIIWHALFF